MRTHFRLVSRVFASLAVAVPAVGFPQSPPAIASRLQMIADAIPTPRAPEVCGGVLESLVFFEGTIPSAQFPVVGLSVPSTPVFDSDIVALSLDPSSVASGEASWQVMRLGEAPAPFVAESLLRRGEPSLTHMPGISVDAAHATAAKIVFEGLIDGSLDPADSGWRPHLAYIIANPTEDTSGESAYRFILAGCGGGSEEHQAAVAEEWAAEYGSGIYAGDIAYFAARRYFNSGDYERCIAASERLSSGYPGLGVRAGLLSALSKAYLGDMPGALAGVRQIREKHSGSDEIPETYYMEAWIAIQEMRDADAKAILQGIIINTPEAPAADKARKILEALGGSYER